MPIYEFVCQDCGHEFEKIQSFSDSSTPSCPNCQGLHVQRRLSAPAIHFKGSGWYITDSKKSAKSSATGGNGESKGEGGKSDSGKGEGAADGASKSETGTKSESGTKSEPGKSESSKSESAKSDSGSTSAKTSAD